MNGRQAALVRSCILMKGHCLQPYPSMPPKVKSLAPRQRARPAEPLEPPIQCMTSVVGSVMCCSPPRSAPRLYSLPLAIMACGLKYSFHWPCHRSLRHICSLLVQDMTGIPIRQFLYCAGPLTCAANVSKKRFLVKLVFLAYMRPPLMRPLPFASNQSSSVKNKSLRSPSRIAAILLNVSSWGWMSAASASNINTWEKFCGLAR
mmetsp:Transcript_4991/g.16150  ORF Transcript_4991/g.16150 Transcript_4991/m.16150 type:complete len:204 (+) Transcript_4991:29-640(+)